MNIIRGELPSTTATQVLIPLATYARKAIPLDEIVVPENRARGLQEEKLSGLMESIQRFGQMHPIQVLPLRDGGYPLVTGRHRLEPMRIAPSRCSSRRTLRCSGALSGPQQRSEDSKNPRRGCH